MSNEIIAISSEEDLRKIGIETTYGLDAHYTLGADITLSEEWNPIGSEGNPFTGHFDGEGHRISGLRIVTPSADYVGFFAVLGEESEVRNLTIDDAQIEGGNFTGVLVGRCYGLVESVAIEGGTVSGNDVVGGLVGNATGDISESYATGSVSGDTSVGGLVGNASGDISESYATGSVSGDTSVGGLVGNASGDISESYATGSVLGDTSVGGLVGNASGDISVSYFDSYRSGQTHGIGSGNIHAEVIGYNSSSGTLKHDKSNVTQNDFVDDPDTSDHVEWSFTGNDAPWRWVEDGQWPQLRAFSAEQQHTISPATAPLEIEISRAEDLKKIGLDADYPLDANYTLTQSIVLDDPMSPIGVNAAPFTGSFDGSGHRIAGLRIERSGQRFVGLFSQLASGAVVQNLSIDTPYIKGGDFTSALAGRVYGKVERVAIGDGLVSGDNFVGGLVGRCSGNVVESFASGVIKGNDHVGGLIGSAMSGSSVKASYAISTVFGNMHLGGLVGFSGFDISINECYTTGKVSGNSKVGGFIGGFSEGDTGKISASYFDTYRSGQTAGIGWGGIDQSPVGYDSSTGALQRDGHNVTKSDFADNSETEDHVEWNFDDDDTTWYWRGNGWWPVLAWMVIDIATEEDLRKIGVDRAYPLHAHYKLSADIALEGEWTPIGSEGISFTGYFNGEDHRISGLAATLPDDDYVGLFAVLGSEFVIRYHAIDNLGINELRTAGRNYLGSESGVHNLVIDELQIKGKNYIGALAGRSYSRVENVSVESASVSGTKHVGGLVGYALSVSESYVSDATVSGAERVGGLVGYASSVHESDPDEHVDESVENIFGYIRESYVSDATVLGLSGAERVGGLVGFASGDISESYVSDATVSGTEHIGGLVGYASSIRESESDPTISEDEQGDKSMESASGDISESYVSGATVSGEDRVGGLVGYSSGDISESYVSGATVSGTEHVGGLVGYASSIRESESDATSPEDEQGDKPMESASGDISESYVSDATVSGAERVGGLVGYSSGDISESYVSDATVSGAEHVGGLVGYASNVSTSYANSMVLGDNRVGGLVGSSHDRVTESYANSLVLGEDRVGGLVGYVDEDSIISACYFDIGRSKQTHGIGDDIGEQSTGVTAYDSSSGILMHGESDVTQSDFADNPNTSDYVEWSFAGDDAPWRWVEDGQWPELAAFPAGQQDAIAPAEESQEIEISSEEDLRKIGLDTDYPLNAIYTLTKDLVLDDPMPPIGVNGAPFTGSFDGSSHRITGLRIEQSGRSFIGLFSQLTSDAVVENLFINAEQIEGRDYVGVLVGRSFGSVERITIEGSTVSGTRYVGGLVGRMSSDGHISESCAKDVIVSEKEYIGGLVGWNSGSISTSYTSGTVNGSYYVGGLVGIAAAGSSISESYSSTDATGTGSVSRFVGYAADDASIRASYFDVPDERMIDNDNSASLANVTAYYTDGDSVRIMQNESADLITKDEFADDPETGDYTEWEFTGAGAAWRWIADGQWPRLTWQPILILNEEDLRKIGTDDAYPLHAHYELSADITLESEWSPIGSDADRFTGTFDGAGHRISGLKIVAPSTNYVGLFAALGGGSEVRNLTIKDAHIEGNDYVGVLAGISHGRVQNVAIEGSTVSGDTRVGGLVGRASGGISERCVSDATVSGAKEVGGLVGWSNTSATITASYAMGTVSGRENIGGLVGAASSDSSISESYATGSVTGTTNVGGLVGSAYPSSDIRGSCATGSVTGTTNVGGLVGYAGSDSSISESYATGSVLGDDSVGGLVGWSAGDISVSYFDVHLSGQEDGIGLDLRAESTGVSGYDSAAGMLQHNGAVTTQADFADNPDTEARVEWDFTSDHASWYWIGDGNWPLLRKTMAFISNEEELRKIGVDNSYPLHKYYVLTASIDLESKMWHPIGSNNNRFIGYFAGMGHTISNIRIKKKDVNYCGIFSALGTTAVVSDLTISSATIEGQKYIGALAGENSGLIRNVTLREGDISGTWYVGGLVGCNAGAIERSSTIASVKGNIHVGGLAGMNNEDSNIIYSAARGSVRDSSEDDSEKIGGFVGTNSGTITKSFAVVYVSTSLPSFQSAGFVGVNGASGYISECHAHGAVVGDEAVGGFLGWNYHYGVVNASYATGAVTGRIHVGGFVGTNAEYASIEESYAIGSVSGDRFVGGFAGRVFGDISRSYFDRYQCGQSDAVGEEIEETATAYSSRGGIVQRNDTAITESDFDSWDFTGSEAVWHWQGDGRWPMHIWDRESFISISTETELREIGGSPDMPRDGRYILTGDLTIGAPSFDPIGSPEQPFQGTFFGDAHAIKTFHAQDPDQDYVGLFGVVGAGGIVHQLTIEMADYRVSTYANVDGNNNVGAVAGENIGTIRHVKVYGGRVKGKVNVAGLVGRNASIGRIERSCMLPTVTERATDPEIEGAANVGGLVGINRGDIFASHAQCEVKGSHYNIGGLVGRNYSASVRRCFAAGEASGVMALGGLVGWNTEDATVEDCYATSHVESISRKYGTVVGGLIGLHEGDLKKAYASGTVVGEDTTGGLVGYNWEGTVEHCYFEHSVHEFAIGRESEGASGEVTAYFAEEGILLNDPSDPSSDHPVDSADFEEWTFDENIGVWTLNDGSWPVLV